MEKRRLELQDSSVGLVPEQVLVLETIGTVDNFIRAVDNTPGLEWLAEYEMEDIIPAHGFEDETDPGKHLRGQLFLVMTDQQALHQLQSLFELWRESHDTAFPHGLAPLRQAFQYLHTIRPWDVEDRIRETGLLEDWRDRIERDDSDVPFEAELWFRQSPVLRDRVQSQIRDILAVMEGELMDWCVIPEIGYHAVLGRLPRAQVQTIIQAPDTLGEVRLLQCEDVMHIRPVGQCAIRLPDEDRTEVLTDDHLARFAQDQEPAHGAPVIALLDGMPLTGHRLLNNRVSVDDPDGYEQAYQAHERVHGTGMASLICHGDLNQLGGVAEEPLYARPILQPQRGFGGLFVEAIPPAVLPADLIHRAVRRLFEVDVDQPPAAQTIRFINLSIGDAARPLMREMSSWARLIDWLSWKYQILFIVSAGNHHQDIELAIPRASLGALAADQREQAVIKGCRRGHTQPAPAVTGRNAEWADCWRSASRRGPCRTGKPDRSVCRHGQTQRGRCAWPRAPPRYQTRPVAPRRPSVSGREAGQRASKCYSHGSGHPNGTGAARGSSRPRWPIGPDHVHQGHQ